MTECGRQPDGSGARAATVGELIEVLAGRLAAAPLVFGHGYTSAWDEAVALVLHVADLPDDAAVLDRRLDEATRRRIELLAGRRISERLPLAYLIGRAPFAGQVFLIDSGVVVPRSPLGALIAQRLSPWLRHPPQRILDLCCGSGCIGIAAALVFPGAHVDLVDVAPAALDLARRNVALHGLEARATVHASDLFDQLAEARWDLILSNPPYVDAVDMASLPAEHRHEPALGLAGGVDGLDLVGRIIDVLPRRLAAAGLFVGEVGASAPALLARYPRLPAVWPDLADAAEGIFLLWAEDL